MRRSVSSILMALTLCGLVLVVPRSAEADVFARPTHTTLEPRQATRQDACPEPNDALQQACALDTGADAFSFISHPDDQDAFRFEALDEDASVRLTLADLPSPYQALVLDWRGSTVAASEPSADRMEVAQMVLQAPGSYFVVVRPRTREISDERPYRLGIAIDYPGRSPRRLVFREDYAAGSADWEYRGDPADLARGKGVLSIAPRQIAFPSFGVQTLAHAPAEVTVVGDVHVTAGADVDVRLEFGSTYDARSYYSLLVNTRTGRVALFHHDDTTTSIVDLQNIPAVDRDGGVNRVVLQVAGDAIRAAVNGQDVLMSSGHVVEAGRLSVRAVSWGDPATVTFDNLVITGPGGSMGTAGTVVLAESFDDPGHQAISTVSARPDQYDFAYLEGELQARLRGRAASATTQLPYNFDFDDATLSVDARLVGETAGRVVMLTCRAQATAPFGGYSLAVAPETRRFTILRWDDGVDTPLVPGQESSALHPGQESNHLQLRCDRSTIEASINGQIVGTVTDDTYRQGRQTLGVSVFEDQGVEAEARFDNLRVTRH